MARVLITGASGFTGRYLAARLAQDGHEVHGTVHGTAGDSVPGVDQLHALDIGDSTAVAETIAKVAPDKIVHLAAIAFVAHADIGEMYRANVLGTRNLLDGLASADKRPSAVLLASSANIYGNARDGMLNEDTPAAPVNDYGITKAASELVAAAYRDRLPIIVTRPFNYTGRGQSPDFLVPKIVSSIRSGADEIELGNVDVERDFSDVRGVVDAYARLLDAEGASGGTFNICSGRAVPLSAVIDLVRQISGRDFAVRVNPAFVRSHEVKSLWGSPARLEQAIGPLRMPPLEETLRWMLGE
jgi:nucleoside-diphosphate-sugar epimerase